MSEEWKNKLYFGLVLAGLPFQPIFILTGNPAIRRKNENKEEHPLLCLIYLL